MKDLLFYERRLLAEGRGPIAGTDEAGRGPLAGPVAAGCCVMPADEIIDGVDDSKKLSPKKRERLFAQITEKAAAYSVVMKDNDYIDEVNILNATKAAMKEAVENLSVKPKFLLSDAVKTDFGLPYQAIIHGDALSYTIACASILAKVARDRLMVKYAEIYPEYGFERNKGYGTAFHIEMLKKYGPCPIHRRSFIEHFFTEWQWTNISRAAEARSGQKIT